MNRRFEITDGEWERLAPLLSSTTPRRGGRWRDHRQILSGIVFRVHTGIPWRDLPELYGPWQTSISGSRAGRLMKSGPGSRLACTPRPMPPAT
jgi:transposase